MNFGNFNCFKLMFLFLRGGSQNSKFSKFQIFSIFGHQISDFSQIQKRPNYPGGGGRGQENYRFFLLFGTFFLIRMLPF